MNTPPSASFWQRLDALLARLRPWRQPLSLLVDGAMIAVAWNITYLFRLGFERWISARPSYDGWVLLGIVALYLTTFAAMRVPQGMWRFSGFGDIQRLTIACFIAGVASAAAVAGVNANCSPPEAEARAASHTAPVASSVATSMLAQWCLTAW